MLGPEEFYLGEKFGYALATVFFHWSNILFVYLNLKISLLHRNYSLSLKSCD